MKKTISDFPCPEGGHSTIPPTVCSDPRVTFPASYQQSDKIADLAVVLMELHGSAFATLPICTMLEVEAFGGDIRFTSDQVGPVAHDPVIASTEELAALKPVDTALGRLKATLDAAAILSGKGVPLCWNLHGPLSILNELMDTGLLFSLLITEPERFSPFYRLLEDSLIAIIRSAAEAGATFFSYGDAVGGVGLVGPGIYTQVVEAFTVPFLKRVAKLSPPVFLHLCPKTSTGLAALEYMEAAPHAFDALDYRQALLQAGGQGAIRFAGHRCINNSDQSRLQKVWELRFIR